MMQPRKSRTDGAGLGRTRPRVGGADRREAAGGAAGFVAGGGEGGAGREAEAAVNARVGGFEAPPLNHPLPSTATTNASLGSNVRRKPATSGPTPSR